MIFLPALRFLMRPTPPLALAARFLAAVIRPPLDFFIAVSSGCASKLQSRERARAGLSGNAHGLAAGGQWISTSQSVGRRLESATAYQSPQSCEFAAAERCQSARRQR